MKHKKKKEKKFVDPHERKGVSDPEATKKVLEELRKKYPQDEKILEKAIEDVESQEDREELDEEIKKKRRMARQRAIRRISSAGAKVPEDL